MLNIQKQLNLYSLNKDNSIVIGSGILNALNIRESHDIDVVVQKDTYNKLLEIPTFKVKRQHGLNVLTTDIFEIGTGWDFKSTNDIYDFQRLYDNSIVINNVRYITLNFLLKVKKHWAKRDNPREKDIKDVEIIEKYLKSH